MKKCLVYVDAENVSVEEVQGCLAEIKGSLESDEQIVGKFYGAIGVLEANLIEYYKLGLEYVETSTILKNHKNVTDMKIIVDCTHDVLENYRDSVGCVCVLSHDCDFVPLYLKLYGMNIDVRTPLFEIQKEKTVQDVGKFFGDLRFIPIANKGNLKSFENQFGTLRKELPDEYSDELILGFLDKKRKKFLNAISTVVGGTVLKDLIDISPGEFSAFSIFRLINFDDVSLRFVIRQYASKFFGYVYSEKELEQIVEQIKAL